MKTPSLLRSMFSFSAMTFVSRLLGLWREVAIAGVFGTSWMTDAFWVAFRIPNFMRRLFAEGSFSTAFVPVLTEIKEKRSHEELRAFIGRIAGTLGGVLMMLTLIGSGGALLAAQYWPSAWLDEPEKFRLTNQLLSITFPFLMLVSLTALAGGVLNSFHRFALPAVTPVVMNLCMIGAAYFLAPRFAVPVESLAWAILVAGVLQLLLQFPAIAKLDLLAAPRWAAAHPDVRRVLRLMVPTLFGSSVAQVNLLLDTFIAYYLIERSQTWLNLSDRLLEFPLGIFGVALGTVILPSLSRHHVNTDRAGFSRALDWGLRTTLMISIPAMLGLVLLAKPIVATLFLHGRFNAHDVDMVGLSVAALSFGLPAFALVKVVLPAFYARQDTKTPVRAGVAAMSANMGLNVLMIALLYLLWHGGELSGATWLDRIAQLPGLHLGLALASSLASYLNLALLWRALRGEGVYQREPGWAAHLWRLAFACLAMVGVVLAGLYLWPDWTAVSIAQRVQHLLTIIITAGFVYVGALYVGGLRLRDLRGV